MSKKYLDYSGLSYLVGKLKALFAAKSGTFTANHLAKVDASQNHVHGNVTNDGKLQTNDVTIASGDKLVITDSSDSNKIARTSAAFDGSSAGKALTKKGTFEDFVKPVASPTNGNFAGLDTNGQITDSGSKAADFKTKQTAVSDPSADGTGVTFIDSISQNTNGVIAPHKKTVANVNGSTNGVGGSNGLMFATDKEKLDNIREGATKVEASATNGNIKINGTETTVYTHPTTTAVAAAAVKVGNDADGHVVLGAALVKGDVGLGNVDNTSDATKKTNFTGQIAANNTGFVTGDEANTALSKKVNTSAIGFANGVCPLNASGTVDAQYLPSYVDDVVEMDYIVYDRHDIDAPSEGMYAFFVRNNKFHTFINDNWKEDLDHLPEAGKIYINLKESNYDIDHTPHSYAPNTQFRWGGTEMVKLADGGVSEITNAEIDTIMAS